MSYLPAFNARLIAEVRKHPSLYNHAKRGSGDTGERMRIWDLIASNVDLNCSGDFAKKRWLQLRDRYRKELKNAIRQNFVTPVRWCYFSHLTWLDPYLKDNIALASGDGITDSLDFSASGLDLSSFSNIKAEMDDSLDDDNTSMMFESSLDRVLAATHRHESVSPALENDDSGPQSVGTSGDEERPDSGERACNGESDQTNKDLLDIKPISTGYPTIKDHIMARQRQSISKQIYQFQQAAKSAVDWLNDEEMLYSRIIGLKLKKMEPKKRKRVRAQIMALLEDSDVEDDETNSVKSARINDGKDELIGQLNN